MKSVRLLEQLDTHCGDNQRVTVFWSCGKGLLCTTGKVVALFDDVLVVVGFTPTSHENLSGDHHDGGGKDCNSLELVTLIDLDQVCAVVAGLPPCREACPPQCCHCDGCGPGGMD